MMDDDPVETWWKRQSEVMEQLRLAIADLPDGNDNDRIVPTSLQVARVKEWARKVFGEGAAKFVVCSACESKYIPEKAGQECPRCKVGILRYALEREK